MPRVGEYRVIESEPNEHRAFYAHLQMFDVCNCPDCDEPGHWMQQAGTSDLELVDEWREEINRKDRP